MKLFEESNITGNKGMKFFLSEEPLKSFFLKKGLIIIFRNEKINQKGQA
jgi:hypothetical protein